MNRAVVVLLAALWAAILVPSLFRGRHGRSPVASVDSFERSMGLLASDRFAAPRVSGRHVMVVDDPDRLTGRPSRATTLRRRRQVLRGLAAAVLVTALAALLVGGAFVAAFAMAVLALTGYVALLVHVRATARRARGVVRRIDAADAPRSRPVSARRLADRIA